MERVFCGREFRALLLVARLGCRRNCAVAGRDSSKVVMLIRMRTGEGRARFIRRLVESSAVDGRDAAKAAIRLRWELDVGPSSRSRTDVQDKEGGPNQSRSTNIM